MEQPEDTASDAAPPEQADEVSGRALRVCYRPCPACGFVGVPVRRDERQYECANCNAVLTW